MSVTMRRIENRPLEQVIVVYLMNCDTKSISGVISEPSSLEIAFLKENVARRDDIARKS